MTATGIMATEKSLASDEQPSQQEGNGDVSEEKIVQEFSHLLEKSKQLFNGLR